MTLKGEQFEKFCDVEYLFHMLLFIYKAVIKDILRTGSAIFEHPTYHTLRKTIESQGFDFIGEKTLEGIWKNIQNCYKIQV